MTKLAEAGSEAFGGMGLAGGGHSGTHLGMDVFLATDHRGLFPKLDKGERTVTLNPLSKDFVCRAACGSLGGIFDPGVGADEDQCVPDFRVGDGMLEGGTRA